MALSDSRENAGMPNDDDAREHAGHQHQEPVAELSETTDRALPSKNPEVLLSDIMQGLHACSRSGHVLDHALGPELNKP